MTPNKLQITEIFFHGIPTDGLIIGKNKFKDRTFFGDNWPNRAHHWFVCNDHPSDKAKINFTVTAPNHYEVIANGLNVSKKENGNYSTWKYSTNYVIPTKVMVIGVADFSIDTLDFQPFEITSYVYPQNEKEGFEDMKDAKEITQFFIDKFGPYAFQKLANVQSTTRYGGMENAGCIFYDENAITGTHRMRNLIAHEIAHQWFGNCASEKNWSDLWLSEGFATYLTNCYVEEVDGQKAFQKQLANDKIRVLHFYKKHQLPVNDTISENLNFLLNPNAYQRGSWTLHMLRNKMGDDLFWKGLRTYFNEFKYSNANTDEFFQVMEKVSNQSLEAFKNQWLKRREIPEVSAKWNSKGKNHTITILQKQNNGAFEFPIDVKVKFKDGSSEIFSKDCKNYLEKIDFKSNKEIDCIYLDPEEKLLFMNQ